MAVRGPKIENTSQNHESLRWKPR